MVLDLMLNGKIKQTVEVDMESMTHGQKTRKFCELLDVSHRHSSFRYNWSQSPYFFDVLIKEDL